MDGDEPQETRQQKKARQLTTQIVKRFCKGFGSGVVLYAGVKVVSALLRNPFRERIPGVLKEIASTDCLRLAGFFGLYPSVYELVREVLQNIRDKKDGWNNCIAGGLAGLTIIIEDPTRRQVVTLFAIARAFGALISTLVVRGKIPYIEYSETLLFCLCCGFLVYAVALNPRLLFTGYYYSVLKWSRDYTDQKLNTLFRNPGEKFLTCSEVGLHKDSCTKHAIKDFFHSIPAFAKLYFPIHLTPVVIFRRKLLLERPKRVLKSLLKNTVFSTAFLAAMVMLAKYVICLLRNFHQRPPPLQTHVPVVAGLVCGLSVLFERANRRKELSLFLIPHTLYALYQWGVQRKLIKHVRYSSVALFSLSMISVMHAYEREQDSLSMLFNGLLKYFVGERNNLIERPKRTRKFSEMFG
ncbi:Hypothetical predicted protein [Mytilus galloprovincialis]|uniref:Transmembrane protein 135 N-terminal domain-containing protein n=1 Tax=Mytilus galloprovincialis TaxID=29158 RepID=A0A8B6EQH8_MYTGA|nr:Hypothetical predicted protein [Mytilus galloprovincialis]